MFVDSSVWFAAADSGDRDNARAKAALQTGEPLITTDHVLIETWNLLHHKLHEHAAEQFWDELRNGVAVIECVGPGDLQAAWEIGQAWRDQDFSLVDLTSFAVMRRLGIERAASLDLHFAIFRFGPNRRRAFTLVP